MEFPIVADLASIKVVIREGRAAFGVSQEPVFAEAGPNAATDSCYPIASEVAFDDVAAALVNFRVVIEISGRERAIHADDEPGTQLQVVPDLAAAEEAVPFELESRIRFVQLKKA